MRIIFLNTSFSVPREPYRYSAAAVRALDALLIKQAYSRAECFDFGDAARRVLRQPTLTAPRCRHPPPSADPCMAAPTSSYCRRLQEIGRV